MQVDVGAWDAIVTGIGSASAPKGSQPDSPRRDGEGATTWMELGESRAAEEVSRSMGVRIQQGILDVYIF